MADALVGRGQRRGESNTLGFCVNTDLFCFLPKMHTPQVGLTFRSLSHHLSLCVTDEVRPIWNGINTAQGRRDDGRFNLLIIPTPDRILEDQFQTIDHSRAGRHRLPPEYGSFAYFPPSKSDWLNG